MGRSDRGGGRATVQYTQARLLYAYSILLICSRTSLTGSKPPKLGDAIRESSIWFQCSILSLLYQVIADRLESLMILCSFLTVSKCLWFEDMSLLLQIRFVFYHLFHTGIDFGLDQYFCGRDNQSLVKFSVWL